MRPKAREQALSDVLSGSAGGEGWWRHDEFFEAWKGDLYVGPHVQALLHRLLRCALPSIPAALHRDCTQINIITQNTHAMQSQYSRFYNAELAEL
jgi:hypothetical protein